MGLKNCLVVMDVEDEAVVIGSVIVGYGVVGGVALVGVGAYPESFRSISLFSLALNEFQESMTNLSPPRECRGS